MNPESVMLRKLAVGHRSPAEEELDLDPVSVLTLKVADTDPPTVAADDARVVPAFAHVSSANLAAQELAASGKVAAVAVQPCWRSFISEVLLEGRDPAELTDEEADALPYRSYIVEATLVPGEDIDHRAREVARMIVNGIEKRRSK